MAEPPRSQTLIDKVRDILMGSWDPIRVAGFPRELRVKVHDEYDSYIPGLIGMIDSRANCQDFERYLIDIEGRFMGHERRDGRAAIAAQALAKLAGDQTEIQC